MNKKKLKLISIAIALLISPLLNAQKPTKLDLWAFESLHIPKNKTKTKELKQITIAVIDDGFMLSHKAIAPFLYKNKLELEGNFIDDDGNNYIDDYNGWDIADEDANVNVPEGKESVYYHGTFVASLITRIAEIHYGEFAKDFIKIMPIKVLEDTATQTYLKKGYEGVQYAIDNGADVICLSWSGGFPSEKQKTIIKQAHAKGIIIVSSAGNFNEHTVLHPANFEEVIAVSGIGIDLNKGKYANYGDNISISAPSEYVKGAYPTAKNAYIHDNGTSSSAALVTGIIALLKTKKPTLNKEDIEIILNNSSDNFTNINTKYFGLLGSGIINAEKAILSIENTNLFFSKHKSRGALTFSKNNTDSLYHLNPKGVYEGFYVSLDATNVKKRHKKTFSLLVQDTVWKKYNLKNIPKKLFIPSSRFSVKMHAKFKNKDKFTMSYYAKSIDSTKLFCKEIRLLGKGKVTITNGSKGINYANNTSCKWQITAPKGKKVQFTFHEMDTEPNVDFVYIADGERLLTENIVAKFSGNTLPPLVTSNTNKVLVWFITDKKTTGKGWKFTYTFVD
jgi:serine protease